MTYDFDYDYSSDIIDDIIDDSINTAYAPPPPADYGVVGDAVGGAFSDAASGIIDLIAPSILASQGYNVDGSLSGYADPTLEQLIASGNLSASNTAGMPDSFVSSGYADYTDMLPDYGGFDIDDYIDDLFFQEDGSYAGIDNTPGEGSGYDPKNVGTEGTSTVPTEGTSTEGDPTSFPEDADPRNRGFMSSLLSALGLGGIMQGGIGGAFGNILGSMIGGKGSGSPLIDYLMMKSLLKDQGGSGGGVPIGGQAYGGQAFNYQDYQPTNLQPALMPGVGYANMGPPETMTAMHGGSTDHRPGDITFAKLEPGEFVIQKPAVDAIGIETLRKINSMGDGRSYNG